MRLGVFLGLAVSLTGAAAGFGQPASDSELTEPDQSPVLSDRRAYCDTLAEHVAAWQRLVPSPHVEADHLAIEGIRMCAIGHIRQGVRRLRFALMQLMEQGSGSH